MGKKKRYRRFSDRLGGCSRSVHVLIVLVMGIAGVASSGHCQEQAVRIGFVLDGPSDENAALVEVFKTEAETLLGRDFQVEFPQNMTLVGDHTLAGASRNVEKLFSDLQSDLIITLGPLASLAVAQRDALEKPVVAAFMPDPEVSDVPVRDGTSGVSNLNYLIAPSALIRELEAFQEIVAFQKLCLLVDKGLLDALPRAKEAIQARTGHYGSGVVTVPARTFSRSISTTDRTVRANLCRLTLQPYRMRWLSQSCSVTRKARSPVLVRIGLGFWRWPTTERSI